MAVHHSMSFPSLEEITGIEEIMDAMDICAKYEVIPAEDGLDDIKERLKLEYRRRLGIRPKREIEEAMLRISEEDEKKRARLIHMYEELKEIMDDKDESNNAEFVADLLQRENTSEDILEDCENKIEQLKQKQCMILVAGETSAGKSSFLNLLFGYEILPTHSMSCTSTITTMRYDVRSHAKIIFTDPGRDTIVIEPLDEAGREELHKTVFMRGRERHEGHDVEEVQVYLPLDILKNGIVLVDTPGIGENEFLEEYLMDFIGENELLGFIYLIFSDAAGGVREDRLLLLLKLIIEQQNKNNGGIPFDPKCALFIANRFDAVPEDCRDRVKRHILQQLGKFWPQFEDSMTVFFSTKKAQSDVDANPEYINSEYKTVLEGLSNLFSLSVDRRIRSSYKWMERVLQRISHYLKTTIRRLGGTQRENQEKSEWQRALLQKLQEKSDTVVRESRADVEIKSRQIFRDIQEYLSTAQAKFFLCSAWNENEIPEITDDVRDHSHWHWITERIDEAFFNRLCTAIEDWEGERHKVSDIEADIVENIKMKLGILQEDVYEVENELSNSCSSNHSSGSCSSRSSVREKRPNICIAGTVFMDIPLQLSPNVQHHVASNLFRKIKEVGQAKKFNKDPKAWSRHRAEKLIRKLLRNEVDKETGKGKLTMVIEQLMYRPKQIIDTLEKKIPSIIDANLQLLSKLEDNIVIWNRYNTRYEQMMVNVESLKKSLMDYGEGYIFVNDFKTNEIKIAHNNELSIDSLTTTFRFSELVTGRYSDQSKQAKNTPKGLWTITQAGKLERDNTEKDITIKMYMPSANVSHTFQEVAKLRCLLHAEVYLAEFLGIHHTDASTPAYIFDGHLHSLYSYWRRCTDPSRHLMRILLEVADGLSYIHTKGMVHMELTSTTITVADIGEVRLTGACIPRHATFPIDDDTKVGEFVYLAPEVLRGDLYVSSADVYGYGLFVYELATEDPAFEAQRRVDSLKDFTDKLQPKEMLHLDLVQTSGLKDLIGQCVAVSESERPCIHTVTTMLKEIKDKNVESAGFGSVLTRNPLTPRLPLRRSRELERNSH